MWRFYIIGAQLNTTLIFVTLTQIRGWRRMFIANVRILTGFLLPNDWPIYTQDHYPLYALRSFGFLISRIIIFSCCNLKSRDFRFYEFGRYVLTCRKYRKAALLNRNARRNSGVLNPIITSPGILFDAGSVIMDPAC